AYLFLPQVGSILTNYGFGAGCHPPRLFYKNYQCLFTDLTAKCIYHQAQAIIKKNIKKKLKIHN
ncbi:hypothetical protein QUA30_27450, partial [Microcoleus sp. Pol14C2]|uniref:hypothetical protein n=1 Tax=unclassified Microcoleus TaxID=2642155 RepID=UPI002FD37C88